MTRPEKRRRTDPRLAQRTLGTRTAAASALAGGCLAVMALWRSAAGSHGNSGGDR